MRVFVLLFLLGSHALAEERVTIHVTPRVVMAGRDASVRLTCLVLKHAENRWLEYGLEGYTSSTQQLEGTRARVMWETTILSVPCGVGQAFCRVTQVNRRSVQATVSLTVVGC